MKRWGLLLAIAIGFVIGGKLLLEDALGRCIAFAEGKLH